jgi:hypothetical protein
MIRNCVMGIAVTAFALCATPALADPWKDESGHGKRYKDERRYYTSGNGIRYWRGDDGRYHCRRSNGTTGLIIGGAAGALAGRAIDTRGERTTGTVVGAAAGALLGREVARGEVRCR